jgi:RHS repeat-associated protein
VSVTLPDLQQAAYRYNALKQRVGKTLPGGVVTHYVYGLDGLLLAELDGLNNVIKEYVYLQGKLLAVRDFSGGAGQVYYAHNDHLGAPRLLSDAAGQVVWRGDFDPFGKVTAIDEDVDGDGSNVSLNIRFPGQYYDAETGLHYNWNRYYDPGTGRYTTPDPIGIEGGLNLYAYVGGNPVGFVDPEGLEVRVNTRNVRGTGGLSVGAHSVTTVIPSKGSTVTYGSYNVNGKNTVIKNDPSDHGSQKDPVTDSIVIPPPAGMTQDQWDRAVISAAENLLNNVPAEDYAIFPTDPRLAGIVEGNCNVTTRRILEAAGGFIPRRFNPPGLNPGLH